MSTNRPQTRGQSPNYSQPNRPKSVPPPTRATPPPRATSRTPPPSGKTPPPRPKSPQPAPRKPQDGSPYPQRPKRDDYRQPSDDRYAKKQTSGQPTFYVAPEPEPKPVPTEHKRRRWGICHPGIAIPVVGILTLLLRVHPCVVCAILLLNADKEVGEDDEDWILVVGPIVLLIQAVLLVIVIILLFIAVWKESAKLLIPYVCVQAIALGAWLILTIYAVAMNNSSAVGLIIVTGLGAVFDLWALITIMAAYLDVRGYRRYSDPDLPPRHKPEEKVKYPEKRHRTRDEVHLSAVWKSLEDRPPPPKRRAKRLRRTKTPPRPNYPPPPPPPPAQRPVRTRYAPDSTSEDSAIIPQTRPQKPSRKPRLDPVKESR